MENKLQVENIINRTLIGKLTLILLLLSLTFFLSFFIGRYQISPADVLRVLFSPILPLQSGDFEMEKSVILMMRLPRVLLTMLVGGGLAISGAAFQGLFRNPLVSPDILGVTAGASFGAVLGLLLFGKSSIIPLFAIPFGVISVFAAYTLSRSRKNTSRLLLVLAGIVVSSVFTALISLVKYVADPLDKLPAITYWLMGSFASASYSDLKLVSLPIIAGILILVLLRWRINILSLGDEEGKSLGQNTEGLKWLIIGAATIITASSVTVAGMIGWVGLVIPHMGRMIVGPDHKVLLPVTIFIGAAFLALIDIVARTATAAEIPIGILTAVIGAPFFAFLLKRSGGNWM